MNSHEPSVLISVINWNTEDKTLRCVQMLQHQTYSRKQIVVVDNHSKLASLTRLRNELPNEVHLIESQDNIGYAGGHALAVDFALKEGFDCFWLLNNDVVLRPQVLQSYIEAYQIYGEAIYGTASLTPISGQPLENYPIDFHRKYFESEYREILFSLNTHLTFAQLFPQHQPIHAAAVPGSSIFLPLSLIKKYGFMDTGYFMYSEEVDYCFRLRKQGVPVIVVPGAYMIHEHGGSSKGKSRLSAIINYYRLRNQLVRIQRYGTRFDLLRAVIKNLLLFLASVGKWRYAAFILRATIDGLQGKLGKTYPPESYI
jgi:GT2 family glycosyltransferase